MSNVEYSASMVFSISTTCFENLQNGSTFDPFMKSITGEKLMSPLSLEFKSWPPAGAAPGALQEPEPAHEAASKVRPASNLIFSTSLGASAPANVSSLFPLGSKNATKGTWLAPKN